MKDGNRKRKQDGSHTDVCQVAMGSVERKSSVCSWKISILLVLLLLLSLRIWILKVDCLPSNLQIQYKEQTEYLFFKDKQKIWTSLYK